MEYQTLYRKYRPQTFDDIIGQKNIVKILTNAIIHSKIAHAYLFCGPRGTGKTSMAKIFAKIVNCKSPKGVIPCNECNSCLQIENKNFLDIIEIDAASNNGVDEIREIKNKINLASNNGKYKVYIIDEVHMLSIGAFNALLKTLEEPPAHIIFILATTEPHKLPITVISRCQRFDFKKFTLDEIIMNLRKICECENIHTSDEVLNEISILADGGMRDAIGLLDQLSVYQENEITLDDLYKLSGNVSINSKLKFLTEYFDGNIIYCINSLYEYENNGKNFSKIVEDLLILLEKILKYSVIENYTSDEDINIKDECLLMASKIDKTRISNLMLKFTSLLSEIKNTSNPRILIEMVLLTEYESSSKIIKKVESEQISEVIMSQKEKIKEQKESKKESNKNDTISIFKNSILNRFEIDSVKKVRINNSLATADKQILNIRKNQLSSILEHMFDDNYSSIVCNLQDCELKVCGKEFIIISISDENGVNFLNERIYLCDELLTNVFNTKIKSIFVSNVEWSIIKQEYVKNVKNSHNYSIMPETDYSINKNIKIKNDENSDLQGIFGNNINDIIEVR